MSLAGSLRRMNEQAEPGPSRAIDLTGVPAGTLAHRMEILISEATPRKVVGRMPVAGNTQPFGLLHGGASCVLAETLGSIGATLHAQELFGGVAVGMEISATHHRPARSGHVHGIALPLHLGGRVATYEIVISDDAGERLCTARLTCMLRPADRS